MDPNIFLTNNPIINIKSGEVKQNSNLKSPSEGAKTSAIKQYIPLVFLEKIDTLGKAALATFFVLTAPVSLTSFAITMAISKQLANNENKILAKQFNSKNIDQSQLSEKTRQILNHELKNPSAAELNAANYEIKKSIVENKLEKLKGTLDALYKQENINPEKDINFGFIGISEETLFILKHPDAGNLQEKKTALSELKAGLVQIKKIVENRNIDKLTNISKVIEAAAKLKSDNTDERLKLLSEVSELIRVAENEGGKPRISAEVINQLKNIQENLQKS